MSVFALFCDWNAFVRTGTLLLSDDAAGVSINLHVTIGLGILHLHNILCQKYSLPLRSRLSVLFGGDFYVTGSNPLRNVRDLITVRLR